MLLACQRIVAIGRAGVEKGEFQEDTPGWANVNAMNIMPCSAVEEEPGGQIYAIIDFLFVF